MYDSDKASDRQSIALDYDRSLEPPEETEKFWLIKVEKTRVYEVKVFGTYAEAVALAHDAERDGYKFRASEYVDSYVKAEVQIVDDKEV